MAAEASAYGVHHSVTELPAVFANIPFPPNFSEHVNQRDPKLALELNEVLRLLSAPLTKYNQHCLQNSPHAC